MKEENKNLTIADVAEALGVSKTTVSRTISGRGRISQATKERVMAYIKEHDYKPSVIAKGLAQSKTYNICVVMPGEYEIVDLHFFQECLFGIQKAAEEEEYDVLLSICLINDISPLERVISNHKVDGVILMRTFVKDLPIEFLQTKEIPFVTIGSTHYENVTQIDHDHRCACRELTLRIFAEGTERIALMAGNMDHMVTQARLQGYREAFEKAGKQVEESLIFSGTKNDECSIKKAVDSILKQGAECILCMDDACCVLVLKRLQELHVQVPKDIQIASFFDSKILESYVPTISSLDFDSKEMGRIACDTLLKKMRGLHTQSETLLPYEIIMRDSTK